MVDDDTVNEDNPRYRFPSKRTRDGKIFEFRKARFVYNGFRIQAQVDELLVAEGFTAVWWLTQNGFPNAVAIMGSDCSEKQADLIVSLVKPGGRIRIIPDGDVAGERCAESLLKQLAQHRFVRWLRLEKDKQPTDYPGSFFAQYITK